MNNYNFPTYNAILQLHRKNFYNIPQYNAIKRNTPTLNYCNIPGVVQYNATHQMIQYNVVEQLGVCTNQYNATNYNTQHDTMQ